MSKARVRCVHQCATERELGQIASTPVDLLATDRGERTGERVEDGWSPPTLNLVKRRAPRFERPLGTRSASHRRDGFLRLSDRAGVVTRALRACQPHQKRIEINRVACDTELGA